MPKRIRNRKARPGTRRPAPPTSGPVNKVQVEVELLQSRVGQLKAYRQLVNETILETEALIGSFPQGTPESETAALRAEIELFSAELMPTQEALVDGMRDLTEFVSGLVFPEGSGRFVEEDAAEDAGLTLDVVRHPRDPKSPVYVGPDEKVDQS